MVAEYCNIIASELSSLLSSSSSSSKTTVLGYKQCKTFSLICAGSCRTELCGLTLFALTVFLQLYFATVVRFL